MRSSDGKTTIKLSSSGHHYLAMVATHRLHETVSATVLGGKTATTKVKVT